MSEIYDHFEDQPQPEEIPDELRQMLESLKIEKSLRVEKLGKDVAKKRDAAVAARQQSGIERVWQEDMEYYLGVDDANRSNSAWIKAAGVNGGISREKQADSSRCSAFFNITAQFCDSASARMGDILLPSGDWNFVVKPTPVPDDPLQGVQAQPQQVQQVEQGPLADAPQVQQVSLDQSIQQSQAVDKAVEKAETRIKDWLTECQYHAEVRRVIEDAVILGTGILKGPVPFKKPTMTVLDEAGVKSIKFEAKLGPASSRVDPHNFFPDPACGEDIHNGKYVIERDLITAKQLREMKGLPGYITEQIDKVLKEGPGKKYFDDSGMRQQDGSTQSDDLFEIWYCYCHVNLDSLNAMGVDDCDGQEDVPAVVTLINDTAIKAFLNPLDTGGFPYDVMPWQQMSGSTWGMGIARKGRVPQEMLNASARALMDNAGLGSRPMWIARQGAVRPVDGNWTLTAGKGFIATEQADVRSVADAITFINVPMMQKELGAIIELAYKMMEDATGVAFLLQGQQGSAPDTVGGLELLNRNASAILRRMARTFDERITEPHIRRYYTWLMQYGKDDEKSDLVIEAVGSSSLVEREIQTLEIQQLLAASVNPAFGINPKATMEELLKIKRMQPSKFQYTEAELAKMQQAPQVIPAVEVAKIRVEADKEIAQLRADIESYKAKLVAQTAMHRADIDTDRDTKYNQSLESRDKTNAQLRVEELKLKKDLAFLERETKMLDYANKREVSLDKVKGELAKTAMSLRVQKELAGVTQKAVQVAKPASEPPQHAADGRAFQE